VIPVFVLLLLLLLPLQALPKGFKNGESVKTLEGDTLKVEYTK
jgi:hypothetical protein